MKKLFVFALLANLGLFGWYQFGRKPEAKNVASTELHASQIRVIAESEIPASKEEPASIEVPASAPMEQPASAPTPTSPVVAETASKEVACFTLTNLNDPDWNAFRQNLRTAKITPLRPVAVETASKYWVYIPPQGSAELAQKKADQLKAFEVTDYFIIQDGSKWQNAISLGIFSSKEAAEKQLTSLQAQGVKSAIVRPREPISRVWSMNFRKLDEAKSTQLRTLAKSLAGASLSKVNCE